MKNTLLFFLLLLSTALGAFAGYSVWKSLPAEMAAADELDWLREEFDLDDDQFARIEELHLGYLPVCEEMCARVIEAQERLDRKMMAASGYSEELEEELARFSRLKEECHREMLKHFYEVAAVMKPGQRERYMAKAKNQVTLHDRVDAPHGQEVLP